MPGSVSCAGWQHGTNEAKFQFPGCSEGEKLSHNPGLYL